MPTKSNITVVLQDSGQKTGIDRQKRKNAAKVSATFLMLLTIRKTKRQNLHNHLQSKSYQNSHSYAQLCMQKDGKTRKMHFPDIPNSLVENFIVFAGFLSAIQK